MQLLYIDLFCGAGGTSTGVNSARIDDKECAKVIACVNHDKNAISSHAANHPEALHFTEDIRTLNLVPLMSHVREERLMNPFALVVLWASLECTNFSKAKGGQPRDADSRTLAEHLFRYIEDINPDYIQIENVEEFMSWGDVDNNGKPISRDKGRCYIRWINKVKRYGYDYDYRILNAANYGAYTSRKRFFGIFAKKGLPIVFPEATHCKNPDNNLFEQLKKWKPVKDCLDLTNEGVSIFDRKKPLAEKTLERIYAGLIKFVAGGKDAFLLKYNSMSKTGKYIAPGLEEPCPTVACQNRLGVAKVQFMSKQFGGHPESKNQSIDNPAGTITCKDHHAFITAYYSGENHNHSLEEPCRTVTTQGRFALIEPKFILSFYSNGQNNSIENPAPTLMTKDKFGLVKVNFMDMQYGNGSAMPLDTVTGSLVTNPKQKLITVIKAPWILDSSYANVGSSIDEPSKVITANRKWHYLMNPQFASAGGDIEDPCFTLIAKMDKRPPYLVSLESGETAIVIYDTDSPMTVKIKEFMALYCIIDITMRMLTIDELKKIQGFPEDYVLIGTQAEQKKFIGNAVEVTIARVLCECLCITLRDYDLKKYYSKTKAA